MEVGHRLCCSESETSRALVERQCDSQRACWCHWATLFGGDRCPGSGDRCPGSDDRYLGCLGLAGGRASLEVLAQTHIRRNLTLVAQIGLGAPSVENGTVPVFGSGAAGSLHSWQILGLTGFP